MWTSAQKNLVTINFCTVSISLIMMQLCWDLSLAKKFLGYKYSADISEFPPIYYVEGFGNSCMVHNAIRKLFGRFILLFQEIKEAIGFSHTNRSFCPTGVSFNAEDVQSKTTAMLYINTWLVVQPISPMQRYCITLDTIPMFRGDTSRFFFCIFSKPWKPSCLNQMWLFKFSSAKLQSA